VEANHGNQKGSKEILEQEVFRQQVCFEEVLILAQERKSQDSCEEEHVAQVQLNEEVCLEKNIQQELRPQVQPQRRQGC